MKNKGLGTGLGALFGDAAVENAQRDFEYIPIYNVEPRQEQPRSVFEQEKIDELADSIREHGILSPLTVRKMDDGCYQIITGERRWRAAREAGVSDIPVRVIVADDKKALELALVENLQREDLSPIEEAQGYRALMNEFSMTQEEVAQRLGKSRPAVANALRLLSLPETIIELVGSGELSVGSARALLALKNTDNMFSAAQLAVKNNMNVREVESLVKKLSRDKPDKIAAGDDEISFLIEAKSRLETALGRRVTIKHGKNKGKIELEYYSQDDFDVLFDELSSITHATRSE